MKKKYIYILSFIIPVLIFAIGGLLSNHIPFFSEIYQVYDARHQYPGFFIELITQLKSSNFFFSFAGGLGFNFFGTLTYYLMSPVNLLFFFLDNLDLSIFFVITIYLRVGLSGLTMAIYLNNQEDKKSVWVIAFATVFALCGFLSSYYYNVMWFDTIIMTPLVLLGIDKLVKNNKCFLYLISLSLGILFNYYMGTILCIFSVIYFSYKLIIEKNINYKLAIRNFIIFSLLSGLLCAVILVPTYYALSAGKASIYGTDWNDYFNVNSNSYIFFSNLMPAMYKANDQAYGPASIYSSLLAIVLVIMFFFNTKISFKEKLVTGIILLFYYLSFSINLLDYAWQLFQKPIWWQSRYSWTFSIFVIIVAFKNMMHIEDVKMKNIFKIIIIVLFDLLFIYCTFKRYDMDLSLDKYLFIGFSVVLFSELFFILKYRGIVFYILIFLFLELQVNVIINQKSNSYNNNYDLINEKYEHDQNLVDFVKNKDDSFYRMEFSSLNTNNDGMLYHYNGINTFNSARNQKTMDFMHNVLNLQLDSSCGLKLLTFNPATLSLLNVKYLIGNFQYFEEIKTTDDVNIYENKYPLSLGFMVNKDILNVETCEGCEDYNLNNIYSKFLNLKIDFYDEFNVKDYIKDTFNVKIIDTEDAINYRLIDDDETGYINVKFVSPHNYLLIPTDSNYNNKIEFIKINGTNVDNRDGYVYLKKGDELLITFKAIDNELTNNFYQLFNLDVYEDVMKKLETNLMEVNEDTKYVIEGTVTATKDKSILFTTIPYEKGLKVLVDGKEKEGILVMDALLGIELDEGTHKIQIDYVSKGFKSGLLISLVGIIITIILALNRKKIMI